MKHYNTQILAVKRNANLDDYMLPTPKRMKTNNLLCDLYFDDDSDDSDL